MNNNIVTTESARNRVCRRGGDAIRTAPGREPINRLIRSRMNEVASSRPVRTAATASAPGYSWQCALIFHSFARKDVVAARPVKISGVALVNISVKANVDPNIPFAICE